MRLPVAWNRSRATAVGMTLVLHAVLVWWLTRDKKPRDDEREQDH